MSTDTTVTSYDPEQHPSGTVSVTPAALAHLRDQLGKAGGDSVRLGVEESGCNGYMYTIGFDAVNDAPDAANDHCFEIAEDVMIRVASAHWPLVAGTELDYIQEGAEPRVKVQEPQRAEPLRLWRELLSRLLARAVPDLGKTISPHSERC